MKINKEIQKSVILDYQNTSLKTQEIASKYNLCRQSIRHILIENNISLKERSVNVKTQSLIIRDYLKGITNKELSKKYNVHRATIQRVLIVNNIKLKTLSETSRKYDIDLNFFKKIDTEFKAYFLGLAYADGNLSRNCMEISLIYSDKQILADISNKIYNKVVLGERKGRKISIDGKTYNNKKQYRFRITSKEMSEDFIKHGLVRNKTFVIRIPKINKNLIRHFIRGYFDGDGCTYVNYKNVGNHCVSIVSNENFCNDIKNIVDSNLNITSYVRWKKNKIFYFAVNGRKQIVTFLDWIYKDCTIKLNRKFEKYKYLKAL